MTVRLAWRSIWRNRRRTLITVISIGFGLSFALFSNALGEGVWQQFIDNVVRMQSGHLTVEKKGFRAAPAVDLYVRDAAGLGRSIDRLPAVEAVKLLIMGTAMARSATGGTGVALMGVDPVVEKKTSPLARKIVAGRYLRPSDGAGVVIGKRLAERLKLKVGKKMVMTANDVDGKLVEQLCRVVGVFRTGSADMDGGLVQVPLAFARSVFRMPANSATQVAVILRRPGDQALAIKAVKRMSAGLPLTVWPWQKMVPEAASYIKMKRGSNYVIQGLLMFLILFTILNTILMSVIDRRREFAVLMAVGTSPGLLKRQIMFETIFLALIGCAIGVLVGGSGALAMQIWGWDVTAFMTEDMSIAGFAPVSVMRAKLTAGLVLTVTGIVFAATLVLSLIPMRRLDRVKIVDELR